MKENPDNEFNTLFAGARSVTASAEFRARSEEAARLHESTARRSNLPKIRLMLATGSAFAVLGFLAVVPIMAHSASLVSKTAAALRGVHSMHLEAYTLKDGQRTPSEQVWYSHDNWRVESRSSLEIFQGDKKWSRVSGAPIALEQQRQFDEMPASMENGIRVQEAFAALNSRGMHFHIEYGPEQVVNGRRAQAIIATRDGHNERDIFQVDLATDLPFSAEHDDLIGGAWKQTMGAEMQYNVDVPASVFEPDMGPNVRVVNLADLRQDLTAKWGARGPDMKVEGGDNVIRDVFANDKGWVFILWTGKIGDRDHRLTLTDDAGHAYIRAAFNPGSAPFQESKLPLVYVEGSIVDGAWFVPVEDIKVGQVKRYELSAARLRVDGPIEYRADYWFKRPWEAMPVPEPNSSQARYTLEPVGKVEIAKPVVSMALLPDYCPMFQDAPGTAQLAEAHALDARQWYWMAHLGGGFATRGVNIAIDTPVEYVVGGPLEGPPQMAIPQNVLSPGKFDQAALSKIAGLIAKKIEVTRSFDSTGEGSGFDWFDLSVVNRALGHNREADEELATAERIRPEIQWRAK